MDKIIYLENYLKEKDFTEQVLPFFNMLNAPYEQIVEETEALFTMPYKNDYLYVFLQYIPRNEHTEKPNIVDRFFNIKTNPRFSKGEWVVHRIFTIGHTYHEEISSLYSVKNNQTCVIADVLKEIQK